MKSIGEKAKYSKPMVLDHRPVRFETAHILESRGGQSRSYW